ncbi:MAG TPA: hypothetical protein VMI92_10720 [Steroidobacteraceae bacterium]|nr:hypothetical protein [Steroidobacteraceae bacterium]
MPLLRSLGMPFHLTTLLFVGISSALLTLIESAGAGVLGLLPALLLVSWLFKYGFVVLEHTAEGMSEPPVASAEMLSPMELRPWLIVLLAGVVFLVVRAVGGIGGGIITGVALLLLPAIVGVLGTSSSPLECVHPLTLARVLRGLGSGYLLVLVLLSLLALLDRVVFQAQVSEFVRCAVLELSVLLGFSFIGGMIHARRLELGFLPRSSPERRQAALDRDYAARRQKVLDDAFTLVRARQYRNSAQPVRAWLEACDAGQVADDVHHLLGGALQWPEGRGADAVAQAVIGWLVEQRRFALALQSLDLVLKSAPSFELETASQREQLARFAASNGRPKFAQSLQAKD